MALAVSAPVIVIQASPIRVLCYNYDELSMVRVHVTLSLTTCHCLRQISGGVKAARVKQVMADMALNNVSNRGVEDLTASEYKRLVIGVQLMRDPGQC